MEGSELDQDAERAQAIVDSLREGDPSSEEMYEAFWDLDALPVEYVREALASWVGPLPDPSRLDHATRLRHGMPLPPLRLHTRSVERDADILDAGPVAEEQLRLAGKSWDGADLSAEERLDGEVEGSFAGSIERRVLVDRDAGDAPLYDVLLLGDESGVVFNAGTLKVAALIAGRRVELLDRRHRVAIEAALAEPAESVVAPKAMALEAPKHAEPVRPEESSAEEPIPAVIAKPAEKPTQLSLGLEAPPLEEAAPAKAEEAVSAPPAPRKKLAAKKTTAKKAIAKKSAAPKKAAAKKASAKKAPAKKTAPEKAVPDKTRAKGAAAKKSAVKKPAAKAAKKTAAAKRPKR